MFQILTEPAPLVVMKQPKHTLIYTSSRASQVGHITRWRAVQYLSRLMYQHRKITYFCFFYLYHYFSLTPCFKSLSSLCCSTEMTGELNVSVCVCLLRWRANRDKASMEKLWQEDRYSQVKNLANLERKPPQNHFSMLSFSSDILQNCHWGVSKYHVLKSLSNA